MSDKDGQTWLLMGGNRDFSFKTDRNEIEQFEYDLNVDHGLKEEIDEDEYEHAFWIRRAGFWENTKADEDYEYPRIATE